MKKALGALLVLSLLVPLGLQGQERSAELQALDHWVGEWTSTGSDEGSGTQVCKWLGDSFVQCEASSPRGFAILWVMEHNAEEGYKMTSFNNQGESGSFNLSIQDDVWTWLLPGGQYRITWAMESQDVINFKGAMAAEGGEWVVDTEMKLTRVK